MMSEEHNPYQSPAIINAGPPAVDGDAGTLTPVARRFLFETGPWMRFLGIVGCFQAGIMILMSVITIAMGLTGMNSGVGILETMAAGLATMLMGFLVLAPAMFLYRAGASLRSYRVSNVAPDLENALKNNKSFWKFFGIVTIISLAMIPLAIVAGIFIAVFSLM